MRSAMRDAGVGWLAVAGGLRYGAPASVARRGRLMPCRHRVRLADKTTSSTGLGFSVAAQARHADRTRDGARRNRADRTAPRGVLRALPLPKSGSTGVQPRLQSGEWLQAGGGDCRAGHMPQSWRSANGFHRGGASLEALARSCQGMMTEAMTLSPQTERTARAAATAYARGIAACRPRSLDIIFAPDCLRTDQPPLLASLIFRPRRAAAHGSAVHRSARLDDQTHADRRHTRGRNPRGGAGR